jgi:hypothetical protein
MPFRNATAFQGRNQLNTETKNKCKKKKLKNIQKTGA